jgi:NADPH-dependent 2,4-dienoyl-CoA reductase/sulfur reductase-like enzyme
MPAGMLLKSEGFASNLSDPAGRWTLRRFASEQGYPYEEIGLPIELEIFTEYGDWFRRHAVPDVEDTDVVRVEGHKGTFAVTLESGPTVEADRVVFATGVGQFAHVPKELRHLDARHLSHSFEHASLQRFRGEHVAVIGAGQSALETAALLHEAGAHPHLIARCEALGWNPRPPRGDRLSWDTTELGRGWKLRAYTAAPGAFRLLPDDTRARLVRTTLGPKGAWWLRDRVPDTIPQFTGTRVTGAEAANGEVVLQLESGSALSELAVRHVIAATGYRVDVDRLMILPEQLRSRIERSTGSPRLNQRFESTVPGLHFVGLAAADSFGPAMRFVFGSAFAARRVAASDSRAP